MESELGGEGQTSDLLRLEASLEGAWRRVVVSLRRGRCVCQEMTLRNASSEGA